jgi:hypothetical protein
MYGMIRYSTCSVIFSRRRLSLTNSRTLTSLLRFSSPGLSEDVFTADFTILPESSNLHSTERPPSSAGSEKPPVRSLLQPISTSTGSPKPTCTTTTVVPVSTINADTMDGFSSPPRANGAVHSRADQLDQAWFRLLFIVWPAIFGLSMAL